MKYFHYLREFGTIDGHDFSGLTVQQRLFLSAVLTKYRYIDDWNKTKPTLAEIIFGGDNVWTKTNFKAFANMIDNIVHCELGSLVDFVKKNAKKFADGSETNDIVDEATAKKYYIKAINIDMSQVFLTRNGDGHVRNDGDDKSGLSQIACKAFILAAASSNIAFPQWRMISIFNWVTDRLTADNIKAANTTVIKRSMEKWLRQVEISGEFEKRTNIFLVDTKNFQQSYKKMYPEIYIRGCSKPKKAAI